MKTFLKLSIEGTVQEEPCGLLNTHADGYIKTEAVLQRGLERGSTMVERH